MILSNNVLIKPDQDFTQTKSGLKIVDEANQHLHVAVTGTVLEAPRELVYLGYEMAKLDKNNALQLQRIRDINDITMPFDTDLEIKEGDRVVFSYVYQMDKLDLFKDNLLIPYSELFCRINDGEIYPLNGNIIVEQIKKDIVIGNVKIGEKRSDTEGVVKYAGCVNRDYLTLPLQPKYRDDERITVGTKVYFPKNGLTRIEYQLHNSLSEVELWAGQRKDILMFEN